VADGAASDSPYSGREAAFVLVLTEVRLPPLFLISCVLFLMYLLRRNYLLAYTAQSHILDGGCRSCRMQA